ncbi:MAG TPA: hypothetical protein VL400_24025 [Polyangiaceae bacterium]|jgi:hypothetical protein|nr:hypothetical protein [Polyangiaceae bacterium]
MAEKKTAAKSAGAKKSAAAKPNLKKAPPKPRGKSTAPRSPLTLVKEKFKTKADLVAAVKAFTEGDLWLGRLSSDRGGDKGLARVSNAKLLKLHATFTEVKEKFGTRDKLIAAILDAEKRTKDDGFKKRISAYPVPRLWDLYKASSRRAKAAKAEQK